MAKLQNAINLQETFEDFKIKNYVETGTGGILDSYGQNSLLQVSQLKISDLKMHSIEILDRIYDEAVNYFKDNENVYMHHGNSHNELPIVLDKLDENPTLFFLDAHFPDSYRDAYNREVIKDDPDYIKIPLEGELRIICQKRNVSKDIIVVDDIRIYQEGPYENGNFQNKALHGGDNLNFVYELLDETHIIVESYLQEGYLICFPINTEENYLIKYVVGA
jgi:hypothetical protein